jgi:hypothetical protein
VQSHETTINANGQPMTGVMLRSGMLDIDDGENLASFTQFIPDFHWDVTPPTSGINVKIFIEDVPADAPTLVATLPITPQTRYQNPMGRGIGIAIEIDCDEMDVFWRMGAPRLRFQRDGKVS